MSSPFLRFFPAARTRFGWRGGASKRRSGREVFRVWHVQRGKQKGIECAEDQCVCANRHRQRQNGHGGKTGRLLQQAEREPQVLPKVIPKKPAAGFVEALFGFGHVAEARRAAARASASDRPWSRRRSVSNWRCASTSAPKSLGLRFGRNMACLRDR